MKRLIALLLTLVLVMSLFAACDSGKKKDKDDDDDETTEASDVVSTDDVVKPIVDPTDDNTGNAVPKPYPGADSSNEGLDGTWVANIALSELTGDTSMPDGEVEFKLVINGDNAEMSADEDALKAALSAMIEATCEASGMTADDFFAAMDMTEDEFMGQYIQEFSQSGSVSDFTITEIDDDTINVDGIEFTRG